MFVQAIIDKERSIFHCVVIVISLLKIPGDSLSIGYSVLLLILRVTDVTSSEVYTLKDTLSHCFMSLFGVNSNDSNIQSAMGWYIILIRSDCHNTISLISVILTCISFVPLCKGDTYRLKFHCESVYQLLLLTQFRYASTGEFLREELEPIIFTDEFLSVDHAIGELIFIFSRS